MRDVLRLLSYIKPYWHFQGFYLLCQLGYFGGFIVLPWIEKILIDDVFLAKNADKLLPTCGLWMLVAFGMYLFSLGFAYFPIKVSQNAAKDIQLAAYHHLRRLGFKFYDTQQTGKVMALFTSDTPKAIEGFQIFASDYPTNTILLIVTIPVVMSVSWQLCLLSLLLAGVTVSIPILLNKSLNRIGEEVQEQNAVLSSNLQESIAGSRELKGLGKELYDLKNIPSLPEATCDNSYQTGKDSKGRGYLSHLVVKRCAGASGGRWVCPTRRYDCGRTLCSRHVVQCPTTSCAFSRKPASQYSIRHGGCSSDLRVL